MLLPPGFLDVVCAGNVGKPLPRLLRCVEGFAISQQLAIEGNGSGMARFRFLSRNGAFVVTASLFPGLKLV